LANQDMPSTRREEIIFTERPHGGGLLIECPHPIRWNVEGFERRQRREMRDIQRLENPKLEIRYQMKREFSWSHKEPTYFDLPVTRSTNESVKRLKIRCL